MKPVTDPALLALLDQPVPVDRETALKLDEAERRQQDFDTMSRTEQMLVGAGQSVDELVTGVKGIFGGDTSQARADQAMVDSVDGGYKTAGKVLGDIGMASVPGIGLAGAVGRSVPLATRAAAGLAGEAWGAGAVEGIQNEDALTGAFAAGTTALVGGGLPKALGVGGSKVAQEFSKRGINLTPGQRWGGIVKATEDLLGMIPGTAGGVRAAKERALESWNKTLRNGSPPHEAMQAIKNTFNESYKEVFGGKMRLHGELAPRWGQVMREATQSLPTDEADKIINLLGKLSKNIDGEVAGTTVQSMHRALGKLASSAARKGDGTQADLYNKAREILVSHMPKGKAGHLKELNADYARFKVIEDATGKVSPAKRQTPGTITPNDLMASATAGNRGQAARGQALHQREAADAASVLGGGMPGSYGLPAMAADASPLIQAGMVMANPALGAAGLATRAAAINPISQRMLASEAAGTLGRRIPSLAAGTQLSDLYDPEDAIDRMRILAEQLRRR